MRHVTLVCEPFGPNLGSWSYTASPGVGWHMQGVAAVDQNTPVAGTKIRRGVGQMKFSANLCFLWSDRPLPDAIRAVKATGFDAVDGQQFDSWAACGAIFIQKHLGAASSFYFVLE